MRKRVLALAVVSLSLPVTAEAHFNLTMPPSIAKSTEGGKGDAPCGPDTQAKAANATVTAVTGGQVLMLHIDETVPHPGFYRFALSTSTPPTFPADNVVKDSAGKVLLPTSSGTSATADYQDPAKFPVLADHMFVHTSGAAQEFPSAAVPGEVTVPNINCEKCTLQVIEFMAAHGSNGDSAGFFYHHCALLKITADPSKPIFDPNAAGGGGGAGGAGGNGNAGAAGAGTVAGTGGAAGGAGGTGGASSAGASSAGAPAAGGATSFAGSPTVSAGTSAGGATSAGASSSSAGSSTAPPAEPADGGGGCSLGHGTPSSVPLLALLAGLFVLGRRRVRR